MLRWFLRLCRKMQFKVSLRWRWLYLLLWTWNVLSWLDLCSRMLQENTKQKCFIFSMEISFPWSNFLIFLHLSGKLLETSDVYEDLTSLLTTEKPSTLEFLQQSGFLSRKTMLSLTFLWHCKTLNDGIDIFQLKILLCQGFSTLQMKTNWNSFEETRIGL